MRIFNYKFTQYIVMFTFLFLLAGSLFAGRTKVSGFPIMAYSNETRLMGGGFLNILKETERDSIKNELLITNLVIYTANKQFQILSIPQIKLRNEQYRLSLDLRGRNWPDKFFGIGNVSDKHRFEKYTQKQLKAGLNADVRVWKQLYTGVKTAYIQEEITKFNPLTIPVTDSILGIDGKQNYWGYGALLRYKTTDSDLYPTRGVNLSAQYMQYQHDIPAPDNHKFSMSTLELNHYLSPVEGAVLAMQSSFVRSYDDAPFSFMPELGERLRAYDSKRFIDKVMIAQRAEIRVFPSEFTTAKANGLLQNEFSRRWGFVLFTEFGQVTSEEPELLWKRNHYSTGFGLRYSISAEPRLNLRMDFAFGENGLNFIVQGSEVF